MKEEEEKGQFFSALQFSLALLPAALQRQIVQKTEEETTTLFLPFLDELSAKESIRGNHIALIFGSLSLWCFHLRQLPARE